MRKIYIAAVCSAAFAVAAWSATRVDEHPQADQRPSQQRSHDTDTSATQSFVDRHIGDASYIEGVLECLDSGKLDDAKHLLRLRQDGSIVAVNNYLGKTDESTQRRARSVFARIAKHREQAPFHYKGKLPQDTNESANVSLILSGYR